MLRTILDSQDFSEWETCLATRLGTHRSNLEGAASAFSARVRHGIVGDLELLHFQGSGRLLLERTQVEHPLLWVPIQGSGVERINGHTWETYPEQPLLFQPGDDLIGTTDDHIEGFSVLLPPEAEPGTSITQVNGFSRATGRWLTQLTQRLADAMGDPSRCPAEAAEALIVSLDPEMGPLQGAPCFQRSRAERKRWDLAMATVDWMQSRLHQAFSIDELAAALNAPKRTIQVACVSVFGRPPLAQAQLLRLRALRQSLQHNEHSDLSIAALMQRHGLRASGDTAQRYRQRFGETPRQTRQRAWL